jgi:hypothetical protein
MLLVDLLGTDMAFFTLQRSLTFCYPPLNLAVIAAIHDEEPESPFALAHDEDIGGWSAMIGDCLMACGGSMGFWSIVTATGLAPVEVWLGLLLGAGSSMERSRSGDDEGFYRRDGILVLGIDRP